MIRFTLACLLGLPALPALAADAAYSRADLDGFFSGDSSLQPGDRGPISTPPPPPPGVWVNPEDLGNQVSLALDFHGRKPSDEERKTIDDALYFVMNTDVGYDLCHYVTPDGCDADTFDRNNIEIRIKPLPNAYASTPLYTIGNKKIITIDPEMFTKRYLLGDLASVMAHELSHVNDVTEFKSPLREAKMATEKKAYLTGLQVYTELYQNWPSRISRDTEMHMMMLAWHRQVEKGRNFEKVSLNGTVWNLDKYIKKNLPDSTSPGGFVHAMTRVFNPDLVAANYGAHNMAITEALATKQGKQMTEFLAWRKLHNMDQAGYYKEPPLPPVVPNPTVNPHPQQPSNPHGGSINPGSGGGGGGNGGNPNPNPCPNPHFNPDGSAGC